eukprot:GHVU01187073.1.p3 GENE.GHVU01187073.1~~GHVU01187073.1.p3  ORF type:complete len:100 (-),score=7.08 GHVU01187073.1:621-920(-)
MAATLQRTAPHACMHACMYVCMYAYNGDSSNRGRHIRVDPLAHPRIHSYRQKRQNRQTHRETDRQGRTRSLTYAHAGITTWESSMGGFTVGGEAVHVWA